MHSCNARNMRSFWAKMLVVAGSMFSVPAQAQNCGPGFYQDCLDRLENVGVERCLDANPGNPGPIVSGSRVTTQPCVDGGVAPNQRWYFTHWHPPPIPGGFGFDNPAKVVTAVALSFLVVNQMRAAISTAAEGEHPVAGTCMGWRSDVPGLGFIGPTADFRTHTFQVVMRTCLSPAIVSTMWIVTDLFKRAAVGPFSVPMSLGSNPRRFQIQTNVCGPPFGTVPIALIPGLGNVPAALIGIMCKDRTAESSDYHPTVLCLTGPRPPRVLDAPVTLEVCEPGNTYQLWQVWAERLRS